MWFKNARIFQLTEGFSMDTEAFSEALREHQLKPCGSMDMESLGWVSPFGADNDLFILQSGDALMFTLGGEEKILPTAAVNHQLNQKLEVAVKETGHKPGRKAQSDMKQQLMLEMLPQAFVKPKRIQAYIDKKLDLLVVDAASQNAAENLVTHLRQTLGSFKATAFGASSSMAQVLTQWVTKGSADDGFDLSHDIALETLDENKGVVRGRNIEHLDDQMQRHIDNGYLVTQLGLGFQGRVNFSLGHDMGVKSIRFTDMVLDQFEDGFESEAQRLDSYFTVFSLEMRELLQALFKVFTTA